MIYNFHSVGMQQVEFNSRPKVLAGDSKCHHLSLFEELLPSFRQSLPLPLLFLYLTYFHQHTHMHTRIHPHTQTKVHTHIHTQTGRHTQDSVLSLFCSRSLSMYQLFLYFLSSSYSLKSLSVSIILKQTFVTHKSFSSSIFHVGVPEDS